jgi:hypothetical protein
MQPILLQGRCRLLGVTGGLLSCVRGGTVGSPWRLPAMGLLRDPLVLLLLAAAAAFAFFIVGLAI